MDQLRLGVRRPNDNNGFVASRSILLWCAGFFCIFSISAAIFRSTTQCCCSTTAQLDIRTIRRRTSYAQVKEGHNLEVSTSHIGRRRRRLAGGGGGGGPGSSPPPCTAKCGRCSPCSPVHVAVPPGMTPVITEYYPEAWRCKCGNKLYMP